MTTAYGGQLSFPALRGRMGSRDYYILLLPLSVVPRLLPAPEGSSLPVEARAQRKLVARRVPEIARYILEHEDDWLFSSITASFPEDTEPRFNPDKNDENRGTLVLPLAVELLVNDGQHRRAAIEAALKVDPTIGDQTVSVVLFPGESLERNQQMFSDLNRTVQKTSRSLDIMYDHRDPLNQITLSVAERVPLLRERVEKEGISLAAKSAKLITVSALYDNLHQLLGSVSENAKEDEIAALEERAIEFWTAATEALPQWEQILDGELRPAEARVEYISVHSVFFFALGSAGRQLVDRNQLQLLKRLGNVDFRRTNQDWQGICMLGKDIVTRRQTRYALAQMLLFLAGAVEQRPERVLTSTKGS